MGYDEGSDMIFFIPNEKKSNQCVPRNCVHSNMAVAFFGVFVEIICPKHFQKSTKVKLRS